MHQIPKVEKVVVNTCVNAQAADIKQALEDVKTELELITGQRASRRLARRRASQISSSVRTRRSVQR